MAVEARRGCGYRKDCKTLTSLTDNVPLCAYLAGLVDGDGAVLVRRRDRSKTNGDRTRGISFLVVPDNDKDHQGSVHDDVVPLFGEET